MLRRNAMKAKKSSRKGKASSQRVTKDLSSPTPAKVKGGIQLVKTMNEIRGSLSKGIG
jgi:hypothetical protein